MLTNDICITLVGVSGREIVTFVSKIVSIVEGENDYCSVTLVDESKIEFPGYRDFAAKVRSKF